MVSKMHMFGCFDYLNGTLTIIKKKKVRNNSISHLMLKRTNINKNKGKKNESLKKYFGLSQHCQIESKPLSLSWLSSLEMSKHLPQLLRRASVC